MTGVLWALLAVIGWGFGDYLIQRFSRQLGIWKTLFFISFIGTVGLLPFVWNDLGSVFTSQVLLWSITTGIVMTIASIFVFESFKVGKLAVMEPIVSAELPVAVLLAVTVWHEALSIKGWLLVLTIFIGIVLAVTERSKHLHYHKRILEKGAIFAAVGALMNGLMDLLMGASSQEISPLLTVWSVWMVGTVITFAYLLGKGKLIQLAKDIAQFPIGLIIMGILDTAAWVGFAMAAIHIPISVTAAISEGYIIIAILLGLLVNRERLRKHQTLGVILAIIGVILLVLTTG
jgi:drug/metabolite transporter (DMT)-like permease